MTYEQALEKIHSNPWKNSEPGLKRITELMRRLGDPQRNLKFIHVAGSNGKGSVCAMLSSVLIAAGYKTGLCISPYIRVFNERMQVNGEPIADDELAALAERVFSAAEGMSGQPTEFEVVCAMALQYFYDNHCDIVVLEVGLGGALDATNVIPAPVAAVITAIGLEHTEILGDTVEEIAAQKAGIIKSGSSVVISCGQPSADKVIEGACRRHLVPFIKADKGDFTRIFQDAGGQQLRHKSGEEYFLPLLGEHQMQNAAAVLAVTEVLNQKDIKIPRQAVKEGLAGVRWPGRFQLMRKKPDFFADGGHNPQCAAAVANTLRELYNNKRVWFLLGVLADKDTLGIVSPLLPLMKGAVTVTPPSPRAMEANALASFLREHGAAAKSAASLQEGVEALLQMAETGDVIVACGSLYLIGGLLDYFKR